jgi:murein DD-endopeptidase MepM/ murein hydrolase activator NlpD
MTKNAIHNFNLLIKNSADIKSSEHLTEAILKELAKVSKEMSQQKDIEQVWQEQQTLNTTAIVNNSSTSIGEGATNTTAGKIEKQIAVSNTSSVAEGTITNFTVSTGGGTNGTPELFGTTSSVSETRTSTSNASIGEGVADTIGGMTMSSPTSANTTSPISGAEDNASNLSDSIMAQTYASVAAQQTLTVPSILQANSGEPTIEAVKAEIKKKLAVAIIANDSVAIGYWTIISKAFDEGATVQDFDGQPNNMLFTEMYAMLKKSNSVIQSQNFNWESVRKKMIGSIDSNILNGKISKGSKSRWELIKKQLNDDSINVANLFEQYDELFLLLKEVEGLDSLPNTITITTKTKIYPNLSADNLYANIGKEAVYVFLKEINNQEVQGSAVNKGAVKIKNTEATSFIVGESLEFILDEALIKQHNEHKKENINWIIYNSKKKNDKGIIFINEGTSFSYNFDTAGTYKVEAYGNKPGANTKKNVGLSAFVELKIVAQEIVITSSGITKDGLTRASAKEQLFKVSLKNPEIKTLNPLKLYYQVESKTANKINVISEEQELDPTGIVKFSMPNLGEYCIKVTSKDQYVLNKEYKINAIKNEVTSIGQAKKALNKGTYLLGDPNNTLTLEAKTFKINPATDDEKENVKWIIYDSNNKPYLPTGSVVLTDDKNPKKMYLQKWSSFIVPLPKKEGQYTVEAYSDVKQGVKAKTVFNIEMIQAQVTEAYWASSGGSKKEVSGFEGESNWIKASIPYYINQTVRIYFYLNTIKTKYYCDAKTNENGTIFKEIKFDSNFKKLIGFQNRKNAKIGFKMLGIQNGNPYPFKTPANYESDTVLSVTTDVKILDAYFMYDGSRVTSQDEIPFNKKGTTVTIVAKTQNMVGKEIVLTAHKVGEKPAFRHRVIVNSKGVATTKFDIMAARGAKNGIVNKYYVGIEGYSTKHLTDKMMNMVVGIGNKKKNTANLTWGSKVSQEFREKVIEICEDLWPGNTVEMANGLMAVMYRETNRTFAANQMAGYKSLISRDQMTAKHFENINKETGKMGSRAVGLIQFTQAALVSMKEFENGKGFDKLHELKLKYAKMTEIEQLEKVKKYFKNVARLPKIPEDIYVAVFSPDFVGKKDMDTLYKKGTDSYKANPGLDKNNDGIQKRELLIKYRDSFKEGNKSDNIASVNIKKTEDICPKGKCIHYTDVVRNPKINNQSNDIDKNRWHRKMRFNNDHPNGYYHTGVDILAQPNTSLKSLLCGTVTIAGDTHGKLGIIVVVKSKDKDNKNVWIEYCHLSSTSVVVGQVIKHGEEIGLSGHTGNANDILPAYYHVHIEASTDGIFYGGNNRVDPELYMKTKF